MKETLRHICSIGTKEIIGLFRDPLLLALIIYSFTLGVYIAAISEPDGIERAAIAVVDEDQSPLTKRITDAFRLPLFQKPVKISRADIDSMLDEGHFTFVVVFPPKLQEKVLADHNPEIQVNVDATRMEQAFTGNGYIADIITKEVNDFVHDNSEQKISYTAGTIIRNRYNPNRNKNRDGAVNQLANSIAMIALILTGAALIRERERGTLEHLLVTPVNPIEIMIAKICAMSLVVWIATGFSLLFQIHWILKVPIAGSFFLYMGAVALNLFAMTSMGIFLACFARDMPQLGILMILVLLPMQILSGGDTPLSNMPKFVQYVMQFAPTTHCVAFSKAILFRGTEFALIWKVFLKMILLGALYFFLALQRFRKSVSS